VQTITIEAATPQSGRALYGALADFYPELETDGEGRVFVQVRFSSEDQIVEVFDTIQRYLALRGNPEVNVTVAVEDKSPRRNE
jgi:hypothetical protein